MGILDDAVLDQANISTEYRTEITALLKPYIPLLSRTPAYRWDPITGAIVFTEPLRDISPDDENRVNLEIRVFVKDGRPTTTTFCIWSTFAYENGEPDHIDRRGNYDVVYKSRGAITKEILDAADQALDLIGAAGYET